MIGALIAKYLGGRAIKAVAGGLTTMIATTGFPMALEGFTEGFQPVFHDLGLWAGQALATFIIGYLPVYIPANKPDPK